MWHGIVKDVERLVSSNIQDTQLCNTLMYLCIMLNFQYTVFVDSQRVIEWYNCSEWYHDDCVEVSSIVWRM